MSVTEDFILTIQFGTESPARKPCGVRDLAILLPQYQPHSRRAKLVIESLWEQILSIAVITLDKYNGHISIVNRPLLKVFTRKGSEI